MEHRLHNGGWMYRIVLCLLLALPAFALVGTARSAPPSVVLVKINGAIGVGTKLYLDEALDFARNREANLLVIELNTPGGLVTATRDIIQAVLGAPIPVAVYVAPSGARAASAGTYISYAAHFAAMAPGTHLGAATPIAVGPPSLPGRPTPSPDQGGPATPSDDATAMRKKTVNDAVSYLRSLAQLRGRNAEWAEKAVREAATLTADEALKENVIDVKAVDLADLLRQVDGRETTTSSGSRTLAVQNALVVPFEQGWKVRLVSAITDPNIAFILLLVGVYGILFEFWSPGLTGPGVVGGISLIVALMALSLLPVSYAGIALLVLGLVLMTAEAFAPGLGILGLGGFIAFVLGGLFLFDPAGADIKFAVAWPVLVSATLTSALLLVGLLGFLVRVRNRKVVTGAEELIGLEGRVVSWGGSEGRIFVHGEVWNARSPDKLNPEQAVIVDRREGLTLIVSPIEERKPS